MNESDSSLNASERAADKPEGRATYSTAFIAGMSLLAVLGIGGQVPGLFTVLSFQGERAEWDAHAEARDELRGELSTLRESIETARIEAAGPA